MVFAICLCHNWFILKSVNQIEKVSLIYCEGYCVTVLKKAAGSLLGKIVVVDIEACTIH